MVKNATEGRPVCPPSSLVRRSRDSKVPYHKRSSYPYPTVATSPTSSISSATSPSWRHRSVQIHQESPTDLSSDNTVPLVFPGLQSPTSAFSDFSPNSDIPNQAENLWFSPAMNPYTLPIYPSNPLQAMDTMSSSNNTVPISTSAYPTSFNVSPAEIYPNDLYSSWQPMAPPNDNFKLEPDTMSQSFGSYDSINSLALTINTEASSVSDSYACPEPESSSASPGASSLHDLLPEGYFQTRNSLSISSPIYENTQSPRSFDVFPFEPGFTTSEWTYVRDAYTMENTQWSPGTATQSLTQEYKNTYSDSTFIPELSPWNPQTTQDTGFTVDATTGGGAFEPAVEFPFETSKVGEEYLKTNPKTPEIYKNETLNSSFDESDGWQVVPSYPSSTIRSNDSPKSQDSPWSLVASPPLSQQNAESHSHVFSGYLKEPKPTTTRGRQRALTSQEKQEALVVRKAKACWACHLSKIKCSPCSPGSPCQQCERLAGKRRFCWLPCFNDPLEALQTFMTPEYLYGNYSKSKIQAVVTESATSWGTRELVISMQWGYQRSLEEVVVPVAMRRDSELAYVHHVISNGPNSRPTVRKKKSLPLGVPLAAMDDMQNKYSSYIQQIVCEDLQEYVSIAYRLKDPELPGRLLQTIADFYCAFVASGDKCEMLQQALEVHVTSTILQRSLILDEHSLYVVSTILQQEYHPRSSALLAQRQVKTAFYEVQRARIFKILEDWGKEMWNSNKHTPPEKKWATTFSVFLILTLVIDKILASSYSVCETRIKKGADEATERTNFRNLVRLTEKELFDRCKEIFHSSFKTRKAGKEAYNPIRNAKAAFRGKTVNEAIARFVWDLNIVVREFEPEIRAHRSTRTTDTDNSPYTNVGRLASVFLADFIDH